MFKDDALEELERVRDRGPPGDLAGSGETLFIRVEGRLLAEAPAFGPTVVSILRREEEYMAPRINEVKRK